MPADRHLDTMPTTIKADIPKPLLCYEKEIKDLHGSDTMALVANIMTLAIGFSSIAVFMPIVKKMTNMSDFCKLVLSACPCLSGSLPRIYLGIQINENGGKRAGQFFLLGSLSGMAWNATFLQIVDPADVTDWSLKYLLWCFGGLLSGFGLAEFPLIINTLHWSPREKAGANQAMFAGLGNITPGIFLIAIAFA